MDFTTLDRATAPLDLVEFVRHCELLSDGRLMPREQDFSPREVPWLLGRLYNIEVLDGGADYLFRDFGIFWQAIYGEDLTGRKLSEIETAGSNLDALRGQYDGIVESRAPVACKGKLVWPKQKAITYDRLLIPFTVNGVDVSRIVVAAHYDDAAEEMVFYRGEGLPRLVIIDTEQTPFAKAS